jgi:hypothetical protein
LIRRLESGSHPHLIDVDETATPLEEFCAALDCIAEDAMEAGATYVGVIGACTMKAQEMGLAMLGLFDDADSEDEGEEEV